MLMAVINKSEFKGLQEELEQFDQLRDSVIKESREVVKLSKKMIYGVHRNELHKAEKVKEIMKKALHKLQAKAKQSPALQFSGSCKIAEQEYVEAVCFLHFMKDKTLPSVKDLGVQAENYLLGICDLTGELMRKAINASIKENYEVTEEIWEFLQQLYEELMLFDFRNSELRRKFDSIKYNLQKVEHVVLELKLKNRR